MQNISTCCEGQGTRLHNSLPEYVFSLIMPADNASGAAGGVAAGTAAAAAGLHLTRGAGVHFDEYEAEHGETNGEVLAVNRTVGSFAAESSGRSAVRLARDGDHVQIRADRGPANAIVVRYAIPDAPAGGGINATLSLYVDEVFVAQLNLTSAYTWCYGDWTLPYSKNPRDGTPHHLFDEARFLFPGWSPTPPITQGATVKLVVERARGDTAPFYVIDLLDLELAPAPRPRPPASLSVVDFWREGVDGGGWRAAFQRAIDAAAAVAPARRCVWVPAGSFDVGSADNEFIFNPGGVAVEGAGMWHTNVVGVPRFACSGSNCIFAHFAVRGTVKNRIQQARAHGFLNGAGVGSRLDGVWVEHTAVGFWVGQPNATTRQPPTDGLVVMGSRFRNLYADGVNLCNGASRSKVFDSHFRNTGDDGVASWSPAGEGGNNTGNLVRDVTVQLPWRANCFAVYGGHGNGIRDARCLDTVDYPGVMISSGFTSWPFAGITAVRNVTVVRGGGLMWGQTNAAVMVWAQQSDMPPGGGGGGGSGVVLSDLRVVDATSSGIGIRGPHAVRLLTVANSSVVGASSWGVKVEADARGAARLENVSLASSGVAPVGNAAGTAFELTETVAARTVHIGAAGDAVGGAANVAAGVATNGAVGKTADRYAGISVDIYTTANITFDTTQGSEVVVAVRSTVPYFTDPTTSVMVSFVSSSVLSAAFEIALRIPEWVATPTVAIALNGQGEFAVGTRGSYVSFYREWRTGDALTFELPPALRATKYVGVNQVAGTTRWAYELGPVLLTGRPTKPTAWDNATDCLLVRGVDGSDPASWLVRQPHTANAPLRYTPRAGKGHGGQGQGQAAAIEFVPYFDVGGERMTTYPCYS